MNAQHIAWQEDGSERRALWQADSGARVPSRMQTARELDAEIDRWVYVGDSTNDQVMFAHFPHSVGVANIRRFEAQLTHPPRWITQAERGTGFAELATHLLRGRG